MGKTSAYTRRKCFVSYHRDDQAEANQFVADFDDDHDILVARAVGVSEDLVRSQDRDYIMRAIRERFMQGTSVTIVLIGRCTWARRYVDWEIAATLRDDPNNRRRGLMAITLPSAVNNKVLPPRFEDNWDGENLYARWWKYPSSPERLAGYIEDAAKAPDERGDLVDNSRELYSNNRDC